MTVLTTIFAAAAANGLFLVALLLLNRRGNRKANILLAILLLLLVQSMWNVFIDATGWKAAWKTIDFNNWVSPFFWGCALYLYICEITGLVKPNTRLVLLHLLPGMIFFTIELVILYLPQLRSSPWYSLFDDFRVLSSYILLLGYTFTSLMLLQKFALKTHRARSEKFAHKVSWLKRLLMVFAAILIADTVLLLPSILRGTSNAYFHIIMLIEAAAIFAIGYFWLAQTGVAIALHGDNEIDTLNKNKYAGSPVDDELARKIMADLTLLIERDRPYLDNDLRLGDLAQLARISPYYLSQVINQASGVNFYELINRYLRASKCSHSTIRPPRPIYSKGLQINRQRRHRAAIALFNADLELFIKPVDIQMME